MLALGKPRDVVLPSVSDGNTLVSGEVYAAIRTLGMHNNVLETIDT